MLKETDRKKKRVECVLCNNMQMLNIILTASASAAIYKIYILVETVLTADLNL